MRNISDIEQSAGQVVVVQCTGEDLDWTGIVSSHDFPVDSVTEITLRCEEESDRKRHVLFGDKLITCQDDGSFTSQNGEKPECRKLGKNIFKSLYCDFC